MQGDRDHQATSGIVIEPFDPGRHDRSGFSCGTVRLDNFLRFSVRRQQKDDFTRVFVAAAEGAPKVLGYFAVNAHAIAIDELGTDRPRRAPRTGSIPALYLSMIAVDCIWQGKELGSVLAIDALGRDRSVAGEVGLGGLGFRYGSLKVVLLGRMGCRLVPDSSDFPANRARSTPNQSGEQQRTALEVTWRQRHTTLPTENWLQLAGAIEAEPDPLETMDP